MVMTGEQVKEKFKKEGVTVSSWARKNGYMPNEVIRVLNGFAKGNYGKAHEIAVELGMKPKSEEMQRSA